MFISISGSATCRMLCTYLEFLASDYNRLYSIKENIINHIYIERENNDWNTANNPCIHVEKTHPVKIVWRLLILLKPIKKKKKDRCCVVPLMLSAGRILRGRSIKTASQEQSHVVYGKDFFFCNLRYSKIPTLLGIERRGRLVWARRSDFTAARSCIINKNYN